MKQMKIALLAGALALATTTAFAQVSIGGSSNTTGGAAIKTGPGGASGATDLNSGARGGVGAGGANVGVDAAGSGQLKAKKNQTTGSGSASGNMKLNTR